MRVTITPSPLPSPAGRGDENCIALAIAKICKNEFVEPPIPKSAIIAFLKESLFIISKGHLFCLTSSTICIPLSKAILRFSDDTADDVAHFGRLIPITSVKQAIVFAVYKPWQAPADGQDASSSSINLSFVISPFLYFPIASNAPFIIVNFSHWLSPLSIGPAVTIIVGIFILAAAISIPGVILSQFESSTSPSSWWAFATVSTQSAIKSREGREYLIPECPIAIPSQTAGTPNINACPPPE